MISIEKLLESEGLYQTDFGQIQFTWRLLTLKEYRVFAGLRNAGVLHPMQVYSKVFDHCYLGEASLLNQDLPAGITISVGELIMWISGDAANSHALEDIAIARSRYAVEGLDEYMKRVILIALPAYKPEELDAWTRPHLYDKFVLSEAILLNKGGYEPIDLVKAAKGPVKKKSPLDNIAAENRELKQTMGDRGHILDAHPGEMAKRKKISDGLMRRKERAASRSR